MAVALETKRLSLRQIDESDWELFLALSSDPNVMRYVADIGDEPTTRARFESRLPEWKPGSEHWLCLTVKNRRSGEQLGVTGFVLSEGRERSAEVGFLFLPAHHGHGYAQESLSSVIEYGNSIGLSSLTAAVTSGNVASQKVLENQGFEHVSTTPRAVHLNGKWHSDLHYRKQLGALAT